MQWRAGVVHRPEYRSHLLHRVSYCHVTLDRHAEVRRSREKAGVLSGAIVMQRARRLSACREIACGFLIQRRVGAAGQRAHGQADLSEPAFDLGSPNVKPLRNRG